MNALAGIQPRSSRTAWGGAEYTDATHPTSSLPRAQVPPLGPLPLTYTRDGRHWYDLSNARTAIGVTKDGGTLVLFTVDGTSVPPSLVTPMAVRALLRSYQCRPSRVYVSGRGPSGGTEPG